MTCLASKPAWKSTYPNANGRHPIRFKQPGDKRLPDYFIDCGKCEGCRARQRQDWAIRMTHESMGYDRNCFLTITYDDHHCPEEINYKDIRNFIRRMQYDNDRKIRYYACGEYGEKTRRPHYHACIFNEDFMSSDYYYSISERMYGNKHLERIWGKGAITISPFNHATALYTAGYVAKKINDSDTFALQSRRPPLGKDWVRKNHDNIRRLESIQISGKSYAIPKVYLKWLEGTESFDHIKENLTEKVLVLNDQKLRAKKANYIAKHKLKKENI